MQSKFQLAQDKLSVDVTNFGKAIQNAKSIEDLLGPSRLMLDQVIEILMPECVMIIKSKHPQDVQKEEKKGESDLLEEVTNECATYVEAERNIKIVQEAEIRKLTEFKATQQRMID